jgi:rubrerythrin
LQIPPYLGGILHRISNFRKGEIKMDIKENAAYIKGLAEGLGLDDKTNEGKVIGKLIELVGQMSERIVELESECGELREYIEEIDEDLGAVEEDLYFTDEEDEDYDSDFEEDFENDFDDDSGYDELVCPACGEIVCVDENLDLAEVTCPACGEKFGDIELCEGDCESCEGCAD